MELDHFYDFYGEDLFQKLRRGKRTIINLVRDCKEEISTTEDAGIQQITSRIKGPENARKKMQKKRKSNILTLTDLAGVRVVCSYISDVYKVVDWIKARNREIKIVEIQDYIQNPKPSGYRSVHMLLQPMQQDVLVELQIRTIAQHAWATLEHEMHYKQKDSPVAAHKLCCCASQMAQWDENMEQIREELKKNELQ